MRLIIYSIGIFCMEIRFQMPVIAQSIVGIGVHHYTEHSEAFLRQVNLPNSFIDSTCHSNRDYSLIKRSKQDSSTQDVRINPVPVLVFGLTGMFLGAWIGHSIDHKEHLPGEFPEIFTKGTVIGMSSGLALGGLLGYFLGREEINNDNQPGQKEP